MNFQPPEEDDPRDDDQRQQAADALSMSGAATVGAFLKACMEKMAADDTTETEITVTVAGQDVDFLISVTGIGPVREQTT